MTDLYDQDTVSLTLDAVPTQTAQPDQPSPQHFSLSQSVRSLRRAPVRFSGRVARSQFWWNHVVLAAVTGPVCLLFWLSQVLLAPSAAVLWLSVAIVSVLLLAITMGLGSRRLHDTGRTGWLQMLVLIPVVGWVALVVMFVRRGTPGENSYGPASLPAGDRRSAVVAALTIVGLAATLVLSVAVTEASVAAALDGFDALSAAGTSVTAGTSLRGSDAAVTPTPVSSADLSLASQQVGGCWSTDDAYGGSRPVACDAANVGYVVTGVVDDLSACDDASIDVEGGTAYLCLIERG